MQETQEMQIGPVSGGSSEVGNGNLLQYSCLGSPMDRGPWQATIHGVTKSQTQLSTYLIDTLTSQQGGEYTIIGENTASIKANETNIV